MSIYSGEITPGGLVEPVRLLTEAFPKLGKGFYDILIQRAKALKFSDQKLLDAVNHVIDNCEYPEPTIAQFISFDKKVDLFTHPQILKMNNDMHGGVFDHYSSVRIQGFDKPFWASKLDIQQYNLELFNKK